LKLVWNVLMANDIEKDSQGKTNNEQKELKI
jgi:hypothetical protein